MYKKAWCKCEVVVLRNKPIAFFTSSLTSPSSLLKLPNKVRRQRESQISNSLTKQNNNFARASRFFCTFLCRQLHHYPWKCLISPFVKDVNKQWQNSFSLWTWIWLIEIQLQRSSLACDKVSELEWSRKRLKKCEFTFPSYVFVAVSRRGIF